MNRTQQKEYAKHLFLTEKNITQNEIARRTGVSERSIGTWIRDGRWEELRKSMLTSKEEMLAWTYDQIAGIRAAIDKREKENRFATPSEATTINKLTASINKLETETGITQKVEIGKQFLVWLRAVDSELALTFLPLYDAFIKDSM